MFITLQHTFNFFKASRLQKQLFLMLLASFCYANVSFSQVATCDSLYVIDDFDLVNVMLETPNNAPVGTTETNPADVPDGNKTMGGERDAYLQVQTAATEVFELGTDASQQSLRINEPTGGDARFVITYDGDDDDADVNAINAMGDPLGLVGIDLFSAGFQITAKPPVALDPGFQSLSLVLRVYSSPSNVSTAVLPITMSGTFTFPPLSGSADLSSVQAIQLEIVTQGTAIDVEFDDFVIDCSIILPVELSYFNAKAQNCEVNLEWATASEHNFSHFEVERSTDGKFFKGVQKIAGAGNSLETIKYNFSETVAAGSQYYRLKQVDLDGTYEYSKTVVVKSACQKASFNAFPTQLYGDKQLTIDLLGNTYETLTVVSVTGQRILELPATDQSQLQIDVSALAAGIYFITDGKGNSTRFIVLEE
ncbi:MAG: T9SS type A sorting domain-containing protein [Bacteroidota bacterium]